MALYSKTAQHKHIHGPLKNLGKNHHSNNSPNKIINYSYKINKTSEPEGHPSPLLLHLYHNYVVWISNSNSQNKIPPPARTILIVQNAWGGRYLCWNQGHDAIPSTVYSTQHMEN